MLSQLISQEPNPGVQYEYYLPVQGQASGYSWSYGSWSECSSECGGGEGTGPGLWAGVGFIPHPEDRVTVCCPLQLLPSSLLLEDSTGICRGQLRFCQGRVMNGVTTELCPIPCPVLFSVPYTSDLLIDPLRLFTGRLCFI